jgi:hypothetical protein
MFQHLQYALFPGRARPNRKPRPFETRGGIPRRRGLTEAGYRGARFAAHPRDL